jgi:phosphate starvation-inducible PhoH-like protein
MAIHRFYPNKGVTVVTRHKARTKRNNDRFNNIVDIADYKTPAKSRKKKIDIIPRNAAQEDYVLAIEDCRVTVGVGPAGTGKSYLGTLMAIKALKSGEIDKIVITRPAVSVDEQHGFLPGDLIAKMAPWTRPIFDIIEEYYHPKQIIDMLESGVIEVAPLAYLRGRSFKNCFIIGDEFQNCTIEQVKMCLTRIGEGCKMVVTGDLRQHDRGFESNGLKDFLDRVGEGTKNIAIVEFTRDDIERDPIVAEILKIYGEE